MEKKVVVRRTARIDSGNVFLRFFVRVDGEEKAIFSDHRHISAIGLSVFTTSLLSKKLFNTLEPQEIHQIFGRFAHIKFCDARYNWPVSEEIVLPAKKKCIRELTAAVLKWFEDGIKKVAEEHEKRNLNNWLKGEMNFEFTVEVPNTEKTEETNC